MKFSAIVGCVVLAASGLAAHAQPAACTQLTQLMTRTHDQVKALQGALIEEDKDEFTREFKSQLGGFQSCKLYSGKEQDSLSDYCEHHLWCNGQAANAEAANTLVESLWSCTREIYSERQAGEAFIGGRYRVISFEGEAPIAGRSAGLVDFGSTDYARVVFDKAHDMSNEYNLHIYWSFTK